MASVFQPRWPHLAGLGGGCHGCGMGFLDDAKKQLAKVVDDHGDKIRDGIEKAGDVVDEKTQGKYTDKIARGKSAATGVLDKLDGKNHPGAPTDPTGPTG